MIHITVVLKARSEVEEKIHDAMEAAMAAGEERNMTLSDIYHMCALVGHATLPHSVTAAVMALQYINAFD